MKHSSALTIIFLFLFELILSMKVPIIDYKSSLKETQNQLTQLLVQVESSEPTLTLSYVETSITKILKEIKETQQRHSGINQRMNSHCRDEANFRASEISDANVAFKASGDALAKCQTSLDQATYYLPKLVESKKYFEDLLKSKMNERNNDRGSYKKMKKEFKYAITFLNDFTEKIKKKQNIGTTGFSQITENLIKHMTKVGKLKETAPIFLEMTNKSKGSDNLTQILNLVNNLKSLIIADLQKFLQDEKSKGNLFAKIKAKLLELIKQLTINIEKTNSQIISMRLCVSKESSIMLSASSKSSRNTKLLNLAKRTCVDFTNEFITATNIRQSELEMINQILGFVKRRFGQIDPQILKNLNNMSVTFTKYVNGTEFKAYKEYVKIGTEDNLRGRSLSNN